MFFEPLTTITQFVSPGPRRISGWSTKRFAPTRMTPEVSATSTEDLPDVRASANVTLLFVPFLSARSGNIIAQVTAARKVMLEE